MEQGKRRSHWAPQQNHDVGLCRCHQMSDLAERRSRLAYDMIDFADHEDKSVPIVLSRDSRRLVTTRELSRATQV